MPLWDSKCKNCVTIIINKNKARALKGPIIAKVRKYFRLQIIMDDRLLHEESCK